MKPPGASRTIVAFFSLAISCFAAEGTMLARKVFSATLGQEIAYQLYLPPGADETKTTGLPAIYLLHGRGGGMKDWAAIQPELDRLIASGKIPPLVAIMPDAPASRRAGYYVDSQFGGSGELPGGEKIETAFTTDFVTHVDATYRTRTDRGGRIVAGFSMGGYGAIRFALAHPELFGAAIVLSPAVYVPLPPKASSTREFGAFGRDAKIFDDEIYTTKNYPALIPAFEARGLPLVMFIAVGDDEQALADPREAAHDLDYEAHTLYNRVRRAKGITAQLRVLDGGHNWDVWRPAFAEGIQHVFARLKQ